ncbi:MAG: peptidoglycan-binding protein [Alphaproteobacteria bacterium]|nr:peptidoglycan-binding protein [Alphaproteobacteria bacterium]
MRDVLDGGIGRLRPVSLFACGAATILSLAVIFNAFFGQDGGHRGSTIAGSGGTSSSQRATTRLQVEGPAAARNTIQLKYDPIVEDIQRQLQASGHYRGAVDGVLGKKTRAAILEYQKSAGMEPDGQPTRELIEHIRYTRQVTEALLFTGTVEPAADAEERARIRRVQASLAELAYTPGEINGELSARTRQAIKEFQRDRKMTETGDVSDDLLAELAKTSGQTETATE